MSQRTRLIRTAASMAKCRTVDVCDIFGDNSGKALYRLDGNANDESGNYHGTETAITYGGGVYERGAVFNGTTSAIANTSLPSMGTSSAVSFCINTASTANQGFVEYSNGTNLIAIYHTSTTLAVRVNALLYTLTTTLPKSALNHLVVSFTTDVPAMYLNNAVQSLTSVGATAIAGTSGLRIGVANVATVQTYTNGVLDQVRIFNRAITVTEVATLYAECAPTSTVDNINPFEDGSLKALYQFNGDATDKTGVYNGTVTGGTVTYTAGGKYGQYAAIAGGKIDLGSKNLMPHNGDYSISTSVKRTTAIRYAIANRMNTNSNFGDDFQWDSNDVIEFAQAATGTTQRVWRTAAINKRGDGVFHHVVLCMSRTNAPRVYVDGVLQTWATSSTTANSFDNNLNVIIGSYHDVTYSIPAIDQTRFFNKALTPMEVASLYNETTPLEEPMHSLVDPFKDGSGKALYRLDGNALDESGNYNGTATSVTYGNAPIGREAIFGGASSITSTLALTANTFSYSMWPTVTTISSTIQSLIDFSTGRAMLSSGNGTNAYLSYYDGTAYRVFGTYTLTSATRTHIGIAINGASVELFINGVSQGTSACSAVTPSGTMALGKYAGSSSGYLTGREDQLRVFNRVLTASEFLQLYNQGA